MNERASAALADAGARAAAANPLAPVLAWFYRITTALAAVCFVAVVVLVLYQLGGEVFPYVPRSADEFAGYCMGASAFLALPDALRSGDHIRVTLITGRLPRQARRTTEWVALAISLALTAWMTWFMVRMAWVSWSSHEVSSGLIELPMWLPQGALAWGSVAFLVAMIELAVDLARGLTQIPGGGDTEEFFHADR